MRKVTSSVMWCYHRGLTLHTNSFTYTGRCVATDQQLHAAMVGWNTVSVVLLCRHWSLITFHPTSITGLISSLDASREVS